MSSWELELQQKLVQRQAASRYRSRRHLQSACGAQVVLDQRDMLCFCSNDYLGLANHPDVVSALRDTASEFGVGSGASHLVCGHSEQHHQLELELARFTGRDRALLFSTGYMANLAVIGTLLGRHDGVFEDRLNHASLLDGGVLSGAHFQRFKHNDMADLAVRLEQGEKFAHKLIVVDGVFSMDGDVAPLGEITQLAQQYHAWVMVDDAHGLGVLGEQGAGVCDQLELTQAEVPILMGTLGKAFGSFGAFVAGSETLIETLIQFARPYIYTTAIPPAVAAATRASLKIVREERERRSNLTQRIEQFRIGCTALGLPDSGSVTAIQPILLGSDERAVRWSSELERRGCWVSAIRPPTVPENTARLRVTLSSTHSKADVEQLLSSLAACIEAESV